MGYRLDLSQKAFVLETYFGGMSLRSVSRLLRNTFELPVSSPTLSRKVADWSESAYLAFVYFCRRMESFRLNVGRIWEMDELYVKIKKTCYPLILVKDLRTNFILGRNLAVSVTSTAVKEALLNARSIAHLCPFEMRGDGHPSYSRAVRTAFRGETNLSVNQRIGEMGMDQSIEGTNAVLRSRIKRLRGLHSLDVSPQIIDGLILDYNFARQSEAVGGRIPGELACSWRTLDGKGGWRMLLGLAESYERIVLRDKRQECPDRKEDQRIQTLDPFLRLSLSRGAEAA